jgi:ABC-2 type transport system ATP-binding protein
MANAIETFELTRRYGPHEVVSRLALTIPEGVIFGLLGPNGAGKSTVLGLLSGALSPTSGEVRVAGLSPQRDRDRLKRVIGFMPQSAGLYDHLTALENLDFFAALYFSSRREARARARELHDALGFTPHTGKRAAELSGGWRQRLGLACAVLHRPRVLLLDEPTAGVDPLSRRVFWNLIEGLRAQGATIVVTTHYMEEVERCHLAGLLVGGALRVCGQPRLLKAAAARAGELVAVVCDEPDRALAALRAAPGVFDAYVYGDCVHAAWSAGALDAAARTRAALDAAGLRSRVVAGRDATMEDVFVHAAAASPP